jgi:hypothetical protein
MDTLEADILAAFERALREARYDVADDLLRALETSADAAATSEVAGSVASAYGRLASSDVAI